MKIRELKNRYGDLAWPPKWPSWLGTRKIAAGEDGVLKSVRRVENRLSLTMEYDGRDHSGGLEWTPPPTLDTVEKVLKDNIGKSFKAISGLDV